MSMLMTLGLVQSAVLNVGGSDRGEILGFCFFYGLDE